MKQNVVIKVSMKNHKCRPRVLKITANVSGVESLALQGPEKDQILVIGEIDVVYLATLLRKNVGHSEILSVGPVRREVGQVVSNHYPYYKVRGSTYGCRRVCFSLFVELRERFRPLLILKKEKSIGPVRENCSQYCITNFHVFYKN